MRKVLLGMVITGFALVLFITIQPQAANLLTINPEPPTTDMSAEEQVTLEPVPYFSVVQGGSELAVVVRNNTQVAANFSLGHEHADLTFRPQGDSLAAGRSREVFLHVDPKCPVGEIELPVYLRAEVNGERVGRDAVIIFNVIPGELTMEQDQYGINVLWNGEPAPRGATVYYRTPGESEWQVWGETPGTSVPRHLDPGDYEFDFKAVLGEDETGIERFSFTVEEVVVEEEPEPEKNSGSRNSSDDEEEAEVVEPPPPPPKPGTKEYLVEMLKKQQPPEKDDEEEPKKWYE